MGLHSKCCRSYVHRIHIHFFVQPYPFPTKCFITDIEILPPWLQRPGYGPNFPLGVIQLLRGLFVDTVRTMISDDIRNYVRDIDAVLSKNVQFSGGKRQTLYRKYLDNGFLIAQCCACKNIIKIEESIDENKREKNISMIEI